MKTLALLLSALLVPFAASADDAASAGRRIFDKNQAAVVTVQLVVSYNVSYGGQGGGNESKTETVGTVIDPSGLTVISLSMIDPSAIMNARSDGMQQSMKVDTEVKDAKLILLDGTELPAKVVLRDKDLDAAFLRPVEKPAKPLTAIDLSRGVKPQQLDEVVCLNRLGKIANRVVSVSLERIDALVNRPRPFYVLSPGGSSGVGSPVFSLSGAPLGIVLIRSAPPECPPNIGNMMSADGNIGVLPIVVPAADILGDAKQALESK